MLPPPTGRFAANAAGSPPTGISRTKRGPSWSPAPRPDHRASAPAGAKMRNAAGERNKARPRWVTVTRGKGISTTSPRPRFQGSWTKSSSHLRPDSPAGTSPSLCASVAILVNKLLSPPPTPTPPTAAAPPAPEGPLRRKP